MKKLALKITLAFIAIMPMFAYATQNDGDGKDAFWFLKMLNNLFSSTAQTATYFGIAAGIIIALGGLLTWLAAGKTNDPSKTKGGAAAAMVIGCLLVSITSYIEMGTRTTGGNTSGLTKWSEEWESGTTSPEAGN